jgi:hypothetical protein
MVIVGNVLVSEDVFEKKFLCDLNACKGACCVLGDGGAPLSFEEADKLEEIYSKIKSELTEEGNNAIEEQGHYLLDSDGDLVTPLVDGKHCAYTVFDKDGTAGCGIEKAWLNGKTKFRKPISCHLYPIRVKKLVDIDALNYHSWDICKPACACGSKLDIPVYLFLKDALIRSYGEEWFELLCITAKELKKSRPSL